MVLVTRFYHSLLNPDATIFTHKFEMFRMKLDAWAEATEAQQRQTKKSSHLENFRENLPILLAVTNPSAFADG